MKEALRSLVLSYLKELNNGAPTSDDDLETRADNFINDVARILAARKDFKEEE